MIRVGKLFCVAVPSLAALISSHAAFATTLQSIQGNVLINHGAGYQAVTASTVPKVGDLVMANAGGSAQVVYSAQCSVAVTPGKIVAVAAEPPCRKLADVDFESTRMNDGAPRPSPDKSFVAPPEERPWLGLVPAAAIGIVAGLCISQTGICEESASNQ